MTSRSGTAPAKRLALALVCLLSSGLAGAADLIFVEGSTYRMGSWRFGFDEEGVHEVRVSPFYISAYEVTLA